MEKVHNSPDEQQLRKKSKMKEKEPKETFLR
jgi:hypothetical protein